ncbi:hypothetical protein [Psychrobacter sp. M13]|uniref:hypothetical protein n=1 Tax=Psychrobacter sp. M13 TaxID=3067275 RepID=UPI00273A99EC|nr:hypothetical protein [Psychrobacter sp. M13]WLP94565.1 hypothetical protein Q9G97_00095 [Psychrobacter sp. M13]
MNENLESMIRSPAIKMANEARTRLDSLSYATGSLADLSNVLNDLEPVRTLAENMANQDLLSQLSKTFPQNKLVAYDSIAEMIKSLTESNSLNTRFFESVELNKAFKDAFEATHLGLKPQTQFVLPKSIISESQFGDFSSIMSKATEAFRQLESLSSLDSFETLSRIKNLPTDTELDKASNTNFERPQATLAEVERLDAKISTEVSNTDDFNKLSEETQRDTSLFLKNYRWLMMNLVVSLYLIEDYLDEDLDLSRKSFTIADNVEEVMINIGHYWNGNKVALLNGFIVTQVNKIISLIMS